MFARHISRFCDWATASMTGGSMFGFRLVERFSVAAATPPPSPSSVFCPMGTEGGGGAFFLCEARRWDRAADHFIQCEG